MAFDVGLGHHVEAVSVAEVVPAAVVGIVAGADGVDVELLHQPDVLNHAVDADHVAAVGVELVAVGALDEHGLAVDQQLRVADLDLAESDIYRDDFDNPPAVGEGGREGVEIGRLGRPLERVADVEHGDGRLGDSLGHDTAGSVGQLEVYGAAALGLEADGERGVGVGGV